MLTVIKKIWNIYNTELNNLRKIVWENLKLMLKKTLISMKKMVEDGIQSAMLL